MLSRRRRGRAIVLLGSTSTSLTRRSIHATTSIAQAKHDHDEDDVYNHNRISALNSHNFPDFIEKWDRQAFRQVGYGLGAVTVLTAVGPAVLFSTTATTAYSLVPAAILGTLTAAYWHVGLRDIRQKSHAIRRNFPVLGNMRYILETLRPELNQYIVESVRTRVCVYLVGYDEWYPVGRGTVLQSL